MRLPQETLAACHFLVHLSPMLPHLGKYNCPSMRKRGGGERGEGVGTLAPFSMPERTGMPRTQRDTRARYACPVSLSRVRIGRVISVIG